MIFLNLNCLPTVCIGRRIAARALQEKGAFRTCLSNPCPWYMRKSGLSAESNKDTEQMKGK